MSAAAGNERWLALEELFQRASDMDSSGRDAFLEEACGGDAELRGEVETLLASADKTLDWLKRPVGCAARELAFTGRRIGSYVLLRLLGEGGMGRVFLAERADDQYRQLVAVKLMHELSQADAMLERFRTERQILADLNHQNIARLLDGGITPEGTPYLVMEYIDGVPLDEYCRANDLPIETKLQLFLRICAAVEYAHKNLVVHRDIKPANVLVGLDGSPTLVDFGIAKLLDSTREATRTTAGLMTPEYASPEQLRGEPITTATDVYGLGVLLYELLSGAHPFAELTRSPVELVRQISEVDPPPPSSVVVRGARRSNLTDELDRIVLMAMQKQPERRYASATALARDVFAYLNGYPVFARHGGWRYRAEKFVLRHKLLVGGLALSTLSLSGFSIEMGVLNRRADHERLKAEQAASFLADMFRAATPEEARGANISARQLLDRGSHRVDKELAGEPEVRAYLLYSIADAYARLGLYDGAKELAERSYVIRKQVLGARSASTAESLFLYANTTRLKGDYADAEPLFRKALDVQRARFGKDSTTVAETTSFLGECLFLEGKDEEAELKLRWALEVFRRQGSDAGSMTRDYLARLLERKGDYLEATQLLKQAAEIDRRTKGIDSPHYTISLHNLAGALRRLGDLYSAEAKLDESLAIERQVLGNGHPDLGYPLNLLGGVALEEGNWRKAEPLLRESFAIWSKLDPSNVLVVSAYSNWGRVLQAEGRYAEARQYFQRALDMARVQAGSTYNVARVLYNLALLEFDDGDYRAAEQNAMRSLSLARALYGGETAPDTAITMITLAEARLFQGDAASAEPILRQAFDIVKKKLPLRYPPVMMAEIRLGEALTAERKAAEAEPLLREALASAYTPPFRIPAWQVGEAESALGWCLAVNGHPQEGIKFLRASQQKLLNDPRPMLRKQAAVHLQAMLQGHERP
jgi:tetratricopeptide (TPR) repeat protein/predicted Ser/Thr protein kinase